MYLPEVNASGKAGALVATAISSESTTDESRPFPLVPEDRASLNFAIFVLV